MAPRRRMSRAEAVSAIQAGLLSGAFVAAFFFVGDLMRIAPLSTPLALMRELSLREIPEGGRSRGLDLAAASEVASWASLGGGLLLLTTLHLLVFVLLAVAAAAFFERSRLPLNAVTGAVFGLVVYSLVFELGLVIASPHLVANVPGLWGVAGANLLAGAVMGGYLRFRTVRRTGTEPHDRR